MRLKPQSAAAIVLLAGILAVAACNAKNTIEKALRLAPTLKASIDAVEAVPGVPANLKAGLEAVKKGIDAWVVAGNAYVSNPTASAFTATIAAFDAAIVEFDKLVPDAPPAVSTVLHIASIGMHFAEAMMQQAAPPAGAGARASHASHDGHITKAELQEFGRQHGLEKYVK